MSEALDMIRTTLRSFSLALLVVLAGCGGGSKTCVDVAGGNACEDAVDPVTVVANLSLNLSASTINNSGSETIIATVVATNSSNQTMSGASVVLSVDSEAEIAVDGAVTDASGRLTGTVRIGENRNNRTITVTALANEGGLSTTKTFQVVGAELTATPVPAVISPGDAGQVQYRLLDSNSNPMVGSPIVVTGPGGVQTEGLTGNNGEFDYVYTAPTTTGELSISASGGGDNDVRVTVLVQAPGGGSLPPVNAALTPVRSASVSANPSVVAVNTDATNNQSQIRVLFLTDGNAPIQNMRVRFDLAGDLNSIGGTFTTGDNLVYSNVNGVATAAYSPAGRASPTDGVTIRACWDYVDFTTCDPAKSVTTTLTVVADPVSVTIGTNALIETGTSGLTYVKRYVVQVVDSSGVAKPDVQISPSVDLLRFYKGFWFPTLDGWAQQTEATCDNEDLNRNNTNEVYADGWVEDANGSFNLTAGRPALEPRKADVAVSFEGSSRTDSSGIVILRLEYPQNLGSWVDFNLTVAASGVSATEGRANFDGRLPVPADAVADPDAAPAFETSPYGILPSLLLSKVYGGTTYQLCMNPN
jgi:hypothetical protein